MKPSVDAHGAAASAPGPHEAVIQLLRLLEVLRRRWLVWVATTGLCVAVAGLALRFVPPRYRASASLVLHQQAPEVLDKVEGLSERAGSGDAGYDAYYQTQRAIMGSRAVTERALERLGLLGPNGAGKSTLMRLGCGFLPIAAGPATRVEVAGLDVERRSRQARAHVGYLPEHVPLYHELRAREHLAFRARIKGVARRARAAEIERAAERTGIGDVVDTPIGQLSRGYRQRVGVADALLGSPPVVVLDERG
ncbi:MAG: ATP-binding cassette domain-containing protein, partial [Myxococcales bacterium]|nr:ATP-binding cassette domain-containing protein [Myxococcales bacterium]